MRTVEQIATCSMAVTLIFNIYVIIKCVSPSTSGRNIIITTTRVSVSVIYSYIDRKGGIPFTRTYLHYGPAGPI